ncbi:hypothetical protein EV356DRAFT_188160 [Viridothelium virens]|uniref:CHAT domain-containing protein n=1 Tax=Viridothelium virens TaxID=1048519 RepID=A0A6A6H6U2_VIRVR|nr:hypothetical protein EV356DRAFT_188160 [Viridothelium virens]
MNQHDEEAVAIEAARVQLRSTPSSDDPWQDWSDLRALLYTRFERHHQMEDLEEIIQTDLRLLCNTMIDGSKLQDHAVRLAYLANAYAARNKQTLASTDNAKSLYFRRLALETLPLEAPTNLRAVIRSQLALSLLTKADEERNTPLMDEAYSQAATALDSNTERNGLRYQEELDTLANVLRQRFLLQGHPMDLDRSIELLEEEVKLDVDDLLGAFHNLSYSLSLRYKILGDVVDLNRAIELGFKAVHSPKVTLESFLDRVRNLVDFLEARFFRFKNITDLQIAKKLLNLAISRVSAESSRFAALSGTLSRLLRTSYNVSNSLEDLEAAIEVARKGVAVPRAPSTTKRTLQNELGLLLTARYKRLGQENDAHEALRHYQSALNSVGSVESTHCLMMSNMASTYDSLYRSTDKIEYLRKAHTLFLEAMASSDVDAYPAAWLNGANNCILLYIADDSQIQYLPQGLNFIHQALGVAKKHLSDEWAQMCLSAGVLYALKYRKSGETEDFGSALVMYLETWRMKTAPLATRLKAINLACNLLIESNRWLEAWPFLQAAVELIPIYCASSPNEQDQQYMLSDLSGITARACTAGLVVGDTAKALEVWEQGRGMIVSSSYHSIGELPKLKNEHPHLYESFCERRAAAFESSNTARESAEKSLDNAYLSRDKMKLDKMALLQEVIQDIRKRSGFENFLRPLGTARMKHLAGDGAIVALNSSQYRTHAILVTRSRITSIELSDPPEHPYLFQNLGTIYNKLTQVDPHPSDGGPLDMRLMNSKMVGLLYKLWLHVVEPICNALGFDRERMHSKLNEQPPQLGACRIKWMASGVFSRLPLHAAGIWEGPCTDVLAKRAISSYAASFRVLDHAFEKSKGIEGVELRGLITSMERPSRDVPYWKKKMFLKSAKRETQWIQAANSKIHWTALVHPSAQEVLHELPKYSLAHFITHGISDPKNPLQSHLVLMTDAKLQGSAAQSETSNKDVVPDKLSVLDLFHCTADNAILAFLAACCTADAQVPNLADENLHIVNAFQIAGFPHVVGTLWPASEFICPIFAKKFYSSLQSFTESTVLSNDVLAFSVHFAMLTLMRDYLSEPRLWACFVHMGP